jgi:two-component system KDP operon response regulator KdpE
MTHIVVVEDDQSMQSFLQTLLVSQQYEVTIASSCADALQVLKQATVDLVLLDLGLPDGDGTELITHVQHGTSDKPLPMIVISARGREQDKIAALDLGADDYVTKPFSAGELLARIRVNLKRQQQMAQHLQTSDVRLDPVARIVTRGTDEVHLTKTEFEILHFLFLQHDKTVTHNQILQHVWGPTYLERPEIIRVHIAQLRAKLEHNPASPQWLKTEAGVGYRLVSRA